MFDKIRDMFACAVHTLLTGQTEEEIAKDTTDKTNKVLLDVGLQEQIHWVNETLRKRQEEIDKTLPPKELREEKDNFRGRIYQASKAKEEKKNKHYSFKK